MKRSFLLAATAATCMALGAAGALAQYGGMFQSFQKSGFTEQDVEMMKSAGAELVSAQDVKAGRQVGWRNEETGNSGIVRATAVEEDGRCVSIQHLVQRKDRPEVLTTRSRRCRNDAGEWVLAPKE